MPKRNPLHYHYHYHHILLQTRPARRCPLLPAPLPQHPRVLRHQQPQEQLKAGNIPQRKRRKSWRYDQQNTLSNLPIWGSAWFGKELKFKFWSAIKFLFCIYSPAKYSPVAQGPELLDHPPARGADLHPLPRPQECRCHRSLESLKYHFNFKRGWVQYLPKEWYYCRSVKLTHRKFMLKLFFAKNYIFCVHFIAKYSPLFFCTRLQLFLHQMRSDHYLCI